MQDRRTMTKADIIENVYERVGGFSKKEAAQIVEAVFDIIKVTLEDGEKIKLSGLATLWFETRSHASGETHRPATKSPSARAAS